jgi:hypothetical protein
MSVVVPSLRSRVESQLRFSKRRSVADAAVLLAMTDEDDPRILLSKRADTLKNQAANAI